MNIFKNLIFLVITILMIGCGDGSDTSTTISTIDSTETSISIDAEIIKKTAMNINNLTVQVHENTFETTSKMYADINKTLQSFVKINDSVINTIDKNMQLLNALAKPFEIADSYSTIFSVNNDYTATTPAFVIQNAITKKYFLVSSESKFFIEGKTIKTYFFDATTLSSAWARVISITDKNKDLYLTILEIDTSNVVHKVSNAFIIKKDKLASL